MLAYQKVYSQILEDLQKKKYPVGSLLPPEPKLEEIYGVSRTTVRRAVNQLAEEGYVLVKQGHGTIVLKNRFPNETLEYSTLHHYQNVLSIRHTDIPDPHNMTARGMYANLTPADQNIAKALQIPAGTPVCHIQRIFYSGDTPLMFLNNYLRTDFFPDLDKHTDEFWDLYPFLKKKYNMKYRGCSEYITASSADLVDSQILHVEPGTPLLHTRRIAQCEKGPLEYSVLRIRTDVCELCVTMGESSPPDPVCGAAE